MEATRLAFACSVLVLSASLVTCRFDKLINPAIRDRLVVSPDSVRAPGHAGSSIDTSVTLRIASADDATLSWRASATAAWLTLSDSAGGAPDTLVLTLNASALPESTHNDIITFTSAQAPGDTVRVPVVFDVLPPAPELSVSPLSRTDTAFAGSAVSDSFGVLIQNNGALALTWTAVANDPWLTVSPASGDAPPDGTTIIRLSPTGLAAGRHTGTVTISAPGAIGSPDTVIVTFEIEPCDVTNIPVLDASVSGSIALSDCGALQAGSQAKRYSVNANAGDTLSLRLESADFVPSLVLLDSFDAVLSQSDDCPGPTELFCILNFRAPATGRYVIEATTAAAGETGSFSLSVVRERAPNGPQGLGQFRGDSVTSIAIGAVVPATAAVFKATLNDPNLQDSVRLEVEVVETSSPFSGTANHVSTFKGVGQAAAIRVSGLTENAGYHWRARTCDRTARCSGWLDFGNVDPAADFLVNAIPENPAPPAALGQFQADGNTPIGLGGGSGGSSVVLKGIVTDADPGDQVRLEVEVQTTLSGFGNTATDASALGPSNRIAAATGPATILLGYHWQARTCDQTGRCSAWVSFPQPTPNLESSADYMGTL